MKIRTLAGFQTLVGVSNKCDKLYLTTSIENHLDTSSFILKTANLLANATCLFIYLFILYLMQ